MKVLDLFSGIGGFSLGLEAAGMTTVAFCEREPFCQAILKKHWPDVPCHDDVTTLDGKQYNGTVDLVCGGYPCQPFSHAGKRQGKADERHLWPEMLRIIRSVGPRWVIAENVDGHIELGFDEVAASLEAAGFTVWSFVIPACAIDADHRRDRVWIMAYADSGRGRTNVTGRHHATRKDTDWAQANCLSGTIRNSSRARVVADTHHAGLAQRHDNGSNRPATIGAQERRELIRNYSTYRAQQWRVEPELGRVANGIPCRVDRVKSLGNSIVPQIAEILGTTIMQK